MTAVHPQSPSKIFDQLRPFLVGCSAISVFAFALANAKAVSFGVRVLGGATALTYCIVEERRKRLQDIDYQQSEIDRAYAEFATQKQQFDQQLEEERAEMWRQLDLQRESIEEELERSKDALLELEADLNERQATLDQQHAERMAHLEQEHRDRLLILDSRTKLLEQQVRQKEANLLQREKDWLAEHEQKELQLRTEYQRQTEKFNEERERLKARSQELNHLQTTLYQEAADREADLLRRTQEIEAGLAERESELNAKTLVLQRTLTDEKTALSNQLSTREADFRAMQESLTQREQTLLEGIEAHRQQMRTDEAKLMDEYDKRKAALDELFINMQREINEARDRDIAELQQQLAAERAQMQAQLNQERTQMDAYVNSLMMENEILRAELEDATGIKKAPNSKGYVGWVANEVMAAIREFDLSVNYHDCDHYATGGIGVWLVRGEGVKPEQILNCKKAIETRLGLGECRMDLDDDGLIVVDFGASPKIKELDPRKLEAAAKEKDYRALLTEPSPELLRRLLLESIHYAFFGESNTGKSTLICNVIAFNKRAMGEQVEVILNDLKFPESTWIVGGVEVMPRYYDFPTAINGVKDMAIDVMSRLQLHKEEKLAGQPLTPFRPTIWVIDETQQLVSTYSTRASEPLKLGLRVGRASKNKILYAGQSPLCSAYKMNKPDLLNATRFWIGPDFALAGLNELTLSPERKAKLRKEIYARMALAEQELEAGIENPPSRFFALVKMQGIPAFLMTLPPPGAWDEIEVPVEEVPEGGYVSSDQIPRISEEDFMSMVEQSLDDIDGDKRKKLPPDPEVRSKLERSFAADDRQVIEKLPKAYQVIIEYASQRMGEWLAPSYIKSARNYLNTRYKSPQILEICTELAVKWGLGELSPNGKKYRYVNLPRITREYCKARRDEWVTPDEVLAAAPVLVEKGYTAENVLDAFAVLANEWKLGEMHPDDRQFKYTEVI